MKTDIKPGLTYTQTYETTAQMRATQLTADVFSTPAMIGLMEGTCVRLTAPYLDEGENTVGMHVDIYHLAPTKIGQKVRAKVTLNEIKGRRLLFTVEAFNEDGTKVGDGTHERAVVSIDRFAGQS